MGVSGGDPAPQAAEMQRALVIGCPGAGKSVFARALRDKTGLPLFYLDMLWHNSDRTTVSEAAFDEKLGEILRQDRWILDGNYLRTLPQRLQACDTVFLLDYPVELCLAGAASRIGQPREDLPWTETEFDAEFRRWIEAFPRAQLPQVYALLDRYGKGKTIVIFKERKCASAYLAALSRQKT